MRPPQAGGEAAARHSRSCTGVLARIDPPLYLGLGIVRRNGAERLFGTPTLALSPEAATPLGVTGLGPYR